MLKLIGYSLFWLGLIFLIIESLAYGMGFILQRKRLMYKEPTISSQHTVQRYNEYLSKRDNVLGWPYPIRFGGKVFDSTGSRRIPAFEDPNQHQSCVSLYGDSFTFGTEVDNKHAWSNVLSQRLSCRVANFGSGGYGTDQAYLRFQHNDKDKSNIVVLGYTPLDIIRNLTRNLDLLSMKIGYGLKPIFIINDQEKLELVPIPQLSEKAYRRLIGLDSPQLELAHENFYRGSPISITKLQFPYTYAVLRGMNYFNLRAKLASRPSHAEFYAKDHPFRGLEITTLIIESFFNEVKQQGRQPVLIIFASMKDLKFYQNTHHWSYQNLMEALDASNIPYLHVGPHLLKYLGQRGIGEIFSRSGGHHNEEGNQVVAELVHAHLKPLLKKTGK
jgi:lysophospholipase L1-like esterase